VCLPGHADRAHAADRRKLPGCLVCPRTRGATPGCRKARGPSPHANCGYVSARVASVHSPFFRLPLSTSSTEFSSINLSTEKGGVYDTPLIALFISRPGACRVEYSDY
jgi:hypothetical protein